jgi:hypothetical protein
MGLPFNPCPKPTHQRVKKTAKQRGAISPAVRLQVKERANGRCEYCGRSEAQVWGLQCAHLVRRWKLGETTENDLAMLCGPSVNSGTCHWKVDYTSEGREWAEKYREHLFIRQGP